MDNILEMFVRVVIAIALGHAFAGVVAFMITATVVSANL